MVSEKSAIKNPDDESVRWPITKEDTINSDINFYESFFNNSHFIMLIIHPESGAILDANVKACNYYGYKKNKITSMRIMDINTLPEKEVCNAMKKAKHEERVHFTFNHKLANGNIREVEVYSNPITVKGKKLLHSIIRDITEHNKKKKEKEQLRTKLRLYSKRLHESHDTLSKILNSLASIVYVSDFKTHDIIFMNEYAISLFNEPDYYKKKCWQVLQEDQSGPCSFCSNSHLVKDNKPTGVYVWEFQNTLNKRWYQCRDQAIQWIDNRLVRLEIAVDITDRKEAEDRILYTATHDDLTKLPNRNLFKDRLSMALAAARRSNSKIAILFIDIDGFKPVNDIHGHGTGDILLQMVAERLLCCVRKTDTVARFGGDEFVIGLTAIKVREDAEYVAKKIIRSMSSTFTIDRKKINVGVSIGISFCSYDNYDLDTLIKQSDNAMYHAKKNGGNNYFS